MTDQELALEIAQRAHKGQKDRGGRPYINHPLAVASMVEGEKEKVVALLHDVAEDTPVSLDSLRVLFGDEIADALTLVTHEDGTDYMEYVAGTKTNPIARAVKIADLTHNMDPSRLDHEPTAKDEERFAKYRKAKELLEAD